MFHEKTYFYIVVLIYGSQLQIQIQITNTNKNFRNQHFNDWGNVQSNTLGYTYRLNLDQISGC